MAKNIIALIFPEYADTGNFPTSKEWEVENLPEDSVLKEWLKKIYSFIDFYKDEGCDFIYDSKNADACIFIAKVLDDCYPNMESMFRRAVYGMENWRTNRVSSVDDEYMIYKSTIKDEMRTEIAAREVSCPDSKYVIAVHILDYKHKKWVLNKEGNHVEVTAYPMLIPDIFCWLADNRIPPRVYNWNEKHGENGDGAHKSHKGDEVSVLLCSREHAEELMHKAIGNDTFDVLYCFDPQHGKYMEYKQDTVITDKGNNILSRSYHSFHIDDENRVPPKVKKRMELLSSER